MNCRPLINLITDTSSSSSSLCSLIRAKLDGPQFVGLRRLSSLSRSLSLALVLTEHQRDNSSAIQLFTVRRSGAQCLLLLLLL